MAIESTKGAAEASIKASDRATEALKTAFQWGSGLVTAIVAVAAFLGYKSVSDARADQRRALDEMKTEMRDRAGKEIVSVNTQVETAVQNSTKDLEAHIKQAKELSQQTQERGDLAFQIAQALARWNTNRTRVPPTLSPARAERLKRDLYKLVELSEKLGDSHSLSYAHAELAHLCYRASQLRDAIGHERIAVRINPGHWPDRYYNLGCFLELEFHRTGGRDQQLRNDVKEMLSEFLRLGGDPLIVLKDKDFRVLLDEETALFAEILVSAKREITELCAEDPEIAATLLADQELTWLYAKEPTFEQWLRAKAGARPSLGKTS